MKLNSKDRQIFIRKTQVNRDLDKISGGGCLFIIFIEFTTISLIMS